MIQEDSQKEQFEQKIEDDYRSVEKLRQELEAKSAQMEVSARQLCELLKINEILHLDLNLEDLLDKVAKAVQRSLGFRRVLISLFDGDGRVFIRMAQAGFTGEEFQRIKEQHVPKESFFQFFQEKYEIGNSFFVSHHDGLTKDYDMAVNGQPAIDGGRYADDHVLVPLVSVDRQLLGVMSVDSPGDGRVPDLQAIGILELFANQAAQALLNVMLYERAKARTQALETLGTISKQIGAQLEFDLLLERMVEVIKTHLKCQHCAVILWDEARKGWYVGAPKGSAHILTQEMGKVEHIIEQVAQRGKPLISEQLEPDIEGGRLFENAQFRAFLPLKVDEKMVGLLVIVSRREMIFGDKDELFWNSLSDQMATAIGNAQLYQNAKYHSITDGLTGLYNHRHFQERLRVEEKRSRRHRHPFSVLMLDVDHFKNYNDVCGHPTGDKALSIIAGLIRGEVRDIDILARYGGEEFSIILTETDKAGAWKVAKRIRARIAEHKFPHGHVQPQKRLTVSIGLATFPEDADKGKDLMERADEALYMAKKSGRDQVFVAGQSEGAWRG